MLNPYKILLNISVIAAIFIVLNYFQILNFDKFSTSLILDNIPVIIGMVFILILVNSGAALRWYLIAKALKLKNAPLVDVLEVTHKSGLFVYFLPAQLAIDGLRVIWFRKKIYDIKLRSLIYVSLTDRLLAVSSQCTILILLGSFWLSGFLVGLVCALLMVFGALLLQRLTKIESLKKLKIYEKIQPVLELDFKTIVLLFGFSGILNFCVSGVVFLIAQMFLMDIDYVAVTVSTVASNLATVIPITPNGVGFSELVFDLTSQNLFGLSIQGVAAVYVGFRIVNFLAFVIASLIFTVFPINQRRKITF